MIHFHWKPILHLFLFAVLWLRPVLLPADSEAKIALPQTKPLQRLTMELLANNQELISMQHKVEALRQEVHAAGALDDPRLGFGLLNLPSDSLSFDEQPMTQKQITIAQRLPWFGKLDLRTQRAALSAARLESILNTRRLALVRELTDAYYELGFVSVSQEISMRMTDHLDQIVRVAESRYATGKGLQQDVLQAQVEQSRLVDQLNRLIRQRRVLEDRINGLLNRRDYGPIEPPATEVLPRLTTHVAAWQALALDANPDLLTRRIEIDQARVNMELSRKAYYPDPDLKFAYGQRDADTDGNDRSDFVSATVVFSLPVWAKRKQDRRYEAAVKQREAAQSKHKDLLVRLPHQVDALAAELDQLRKNFTLPTS